VIRSATALLVLLAVLSACGREVPSRVDPPEGSPEMGVAYGVIVHCAVPIQLGDTWWSFDERRGDWPADITIPPFPLSIWANVSSPYAVPGIVTVSTPMTATFRADVDGSEFRLIGHDQDPSPDVTCL
jgi:hypothetical protein